MIKILAVIITRIKVMLYQLRFGQTKVVIGAGGGSYSQIDWITTDISQLDIRHYYNWRLLFSQDSIDLLLAEHVWEHLEEEEAIQAARNCYIFLKSGGNFRIAVPDGNHPSLDYIESVKPGGSGPGAMDHKILYSYRKMIEILKLAGFNNISVLEYFDEQGVFHSESIDDSKGFVIRSSKHDSRNSGGLLNYTSIIIDAIK